MSNPIITRLGLSQFWYKHWYSDSSYGLNVKYDNLFKQLLLLYFNYGLSQKRNIFLHKYWYRSTNFTKNQIKKSQVSNEIFTWNIFHRSYTFTNVATSIENFYTLRNITGEYFPLKLWVFKYNNWIIYIINWFKPQKLRRNNKYKNALDSSNSLHKPTSPFFKSKRNKILLIFFLQQVKKKITKYSF